MILRQTRRLPFLILLAVSSLSFAAAATSFCKCTCFSNSTIIPLNAEQPSHSAPSHNTFRQPRVVADDDSAKSSAKSSTQRAGNCNDCNRQFCLNYNLPICKGAKEEDVFTTCFQRDSRKDEAVVFVFIFATAGLLIYAAVQPWVERWVEAARERRSYIPVSTQGDQ